MSAFKDLRGRTFGRLTVKEMMPGRNAAGLISWRCECTCGNTHVTTSASLRKGNANSCGCLRKEVSGARISIMHEARRVAYAKRFLEGSKDSS